MSGGDGTRSLLVLGCSARKVPRLSRARAWDLYDGRVYQVLKKAMRPHADWESIIEVVIVSARYGVISANAMIETYEDRLTTAGVSALMTRSSRQLQDLLAGRTFTAVHANLGRDYRSLVSELGALVAPCVIDWACGGIGLRNARTRAWSLQRLQRA